MARTSIDFDRSGLIALIKSEFKLDWQGIHGANHWARVLNHGKNIGQIRKADLLVVELFGFLHDSCRFNDGKLKAYEFIRFSLVPVDHI